MPDVGVVAPPAAFGASSQTKGEAQGSKASASSGDLIDVQIVETLGKGEGVLQVDGRLLRGLFPEGLPQGVHLTLRVVSPGPPLLLQLPDPVQDSLGTLFRPPAQGFTAAVRTLLGATSSPVQGTGEADVLRAVRELLDLPPRPAALARALARWVRSSGLFHEADGSRGEVKDDLKSLVLRLLSRLPEGETGRAARALLGHVEAHQARSLVEGAVIVPLVLPWGEEWIQGELRVDRDGRQGGSGPDSRGRLQMRVEMPSLGPVELELRWSRGAVGVRLALEPHFMDAVRERLPELDEALSRIGSRRVALRVAPLSPREPGTGAGFVEVVA